MPAAPDSTADTAVAVGQEVTDMSRRVADVVADQFLRSQELLAENGLPTVPLTPVVERAARRVPPLTGRLAGHATRLGLDAGRLVFRRVRRLSTETGRLLDRLAGESDA